MSSPYAEFLEGKGAADILCELDADGARFTELLAELDISRTTLSKRLQEGQNISVLDTETLPGKRGTTHKYVLTDRGAFIRLHMDAEGITRTYQVIKEQQQQYQHRIEQLQEWLADNPDVVERLAADNDMLEALRKDTYDRYRTDDSDEK